ncbi:MAG: DUF1638 domain-containing protein [Candidatus Latescibacteria bacterium]|jgi:hypothetical protein|nr:DUF1638 domain-containing protein [Candidatus Latescibacterota bacterium]
MRLYIISCEVFCREFRAFAASSKHLIDMTFQPFGLHDTPDMLREQTQQAIDNVPVGAYDYILIGYGLCSRGTADLVARETPLVMVRAHDCITFFLGSKERYMTQFTENPGTYYYSSGWIERKEGTAEQGHLTSVKTEQKKKRFQEYVEKYGEDNAHYLIEMESQWLNNYSRAAFIDLDIGDKQAYRTFVQGQASEREWDYEEISGETSLIDGFIDGQWDTDRFVIVQPGQRVAETHDEQIITVGPLGA